MYFLSKAISDLGKSSVVRKGLMRFWSYLYFRNAPSAVEFQKESIEKSSNDLLRADKSTMAHGLEARVPFRQRLLRCGYED
jgi:asparagine synthase (glutamine-hydrolysing)